MSNLIPHPDTIISLPLKFQDENIGLLNPLCEEQNTSEDISEIESILPITITSYRESSLRPALQVLHIIYGPIPYYPNTSPEGVLYVHSLQNEKRTPREIFENVQFCHRKKWGPGTTKTSFLNNVECFRENHTCTSIKACEYLHPEIKNLKIREVTSDIWQRLQKFGVQDWDIGSKKREALSWFLGIRNKFLKGTSCVEFKSGDCWYKFIDRKTVTTSGMSQWAMICKNQTSGRNHFYQPLDPKYNKYTTFLKNRASDKLVLNEIETCSFIASTSSRSKYCGIDHIQGQGKLQVSELCPVVFNLITPKDLKRTPYLLWSSTGEHNHAPPPIHKVPKAICQDIIGLFIQMNDTSLTTNKAITSRAVQRWLELHGVSTFGELHPALNNYDRITLCILHSRLSIYPHGYSIGGVEHEYWTKHKHNPNSYIQKVFFDGRNLAVFCLYREQAILLSEQNSFEVDMGFKRVRDQGITEIVFAKFIDGIRKVVTFARIFINSETTEGYRWVFIEFHKLLQEQFGITLQWKHLDKSAKLIAIVADQDPKQMAGFGGYLQTLDPELRQWQFQAQSAVIFCKIHYQRGVEKLVGKPVINQFRWRILMDIPNCQSRDEYLHMCDLIIGDESWSLAVRNWAKYLKQDTIASGLNKFCSRINYTDFDSIRNNTNAVEVAHWRGNSVGRRCTLLQAILNSQALDLNEVRQCSATVDSNISLSYRKKAMSNRHEQVMSRNFSQRTKQIESSQSEVIEDGEDSLIIPELLLETTSSGVLKKKKPPKPKQIQPAANQLETGSKTKKRLRSLTIESDHDQIQYERDETLFKLQDELNLRRSILEIRQKERQLDQEDDSQREESPISQNVFGTGLKSVWNGLRNII